MFLTEEQVRAVLRMDELIPAMARALRDLSAGKVQQPMRTVLPVTEHKGFFAVMPASGGALGAKLSGCGGVNTMATAFTPSASKTTKRPSR